MATSTAHRTITFALLGNPNTGKSTLFSALAGVRQRVGNYPGVTVEKKIGRATIEGVPFAIVDLPGTYSLAPRSPDEMIAVDVLLGRVKDLPPPDGVLCILDASNLQRNLYLVSQVLELGLPTVVALNMVDLAADRGISIDVDRLRRQLGVPVVPIQAHRRVGLAELRAALSGSVGSPAVVPQSPFPEAFQREVTRLEKTIHGRGEPLPRYLVERLLLDTSGYLVRARVDGIDGAAIERVKQARSRLSQAGCPVPAVEAMARYGWVAEVLDGVLAESQAKKGPSLSDRLDRLLTHRVGGTVIFVMLMYVVFQSVFSWAAPAMDVIEWGVESLGDGVAALLGEGALRSLLVDGVVGGVGSVLAFLPQIFILFFFIALLEDCGYMARAAYLMDRLMVCVGLSGKSFIPLLSSFACAIPGIMATRVIEHPRDRLVTILVAPLMSCSARLPVYTLLIGALIPPVTLLGGWVGLPGLTLLAMYLVGMLAAVVVAFLLNRTILRGEPPPFVMELPPYKVPSLRQVLARMGERGWSFVRRAGTLILAISVLVWAVAYFPHPQHIARSVAARHAQQAASLQGKLRRLAKGPQGAAKGPQGAAKGPHQGEQSAAARMARLNEQLAALDRRIDQETAGAYLQQSLLGRLGRWIEPAVRPLGWDWRIGCAVLASFPAREVVIGAMGVIYNVGEEQDESSPLLRDKIRAATWSDSGKPVFTVPVGLSLMVFFALCAQCAATLVVIRRETASWKWPLFTFAYMTGLAYAGAWLTYQLGVRMVS